MAGSRVRREYQEGTIAPSATVAIDLRGSTKALVESDGNLAEVRWSWDGVNGTLTLISPPAGLIEADPCPSYLLLEASAAGATYRAEGIKEIA